MIAEVVVDVATSTTDKVFDYNIPCDMSVEVGDRVKVPFGNRNVEGFVTEVKASSTVDIAKLKNISSKMDTQPLLTQNMLRLCFFMKKKFYLRLIDVINLFLPQYVRNGKSKQVEYVSLNVDNIPNLDSRATKQLELILRLRECGSLKKSDVAKEFGQSALNTLIKKNYVNVVSQDERRTPQNNFTVAQKSITLNPTQQKAVDTITSSKYATFLLHGITGSGKTEVYINCIRNALKQGKTAIMLVPEISLTPQMFARFRNAFGDTVAILHSNLSSGERFDEWQRLKNGQAKIAIGARSCIFAPLENIGLIVVDEEHDSSYYSESNPRYHTHEVARYLAYLNNCPLILGSATPSIESSYLASIGEYRKIILPNRANQKELPVIEVVDMLSEIRNGNTGIFSHKFLGELDYCISQGKQAMIFINRRGFSSFVMCRNCGYVPKCEDCDVSLVYHKEDNLLKCHYCNRRYKMLSRCPKCGSVSLRTGAVGTEQVVEELKKLTDVPVFRLDNDTTQNKTAYVNILQQFNSTKPAILVGTQMIAKGHDFEGVSLVGIVDADVSLHFSDYRAIERTFQLITQVSGRAGRSEGEGKVVLQTYYPKHFAYRCAVDYNYDAFFKRELSLRETTHFPPFVTMLRVLVTSENEQKAQDTLQNIYSEIKGLKDNKYTSDFVYLSAMRCPKKRLQKNFRYQIMIRLYRKSEDVIIPQIYSICDSQKKNQVSIFVELDPQNLS